MAIQLATLGGFVAWAALLIVFGIVAVIGLYKILATAEKGTGAVIMVVGVAVALVIASPLAGITTFDVFGIASGAIGDDDGETPSYDDKENWVEEPLDYGISKIIDGLSDDDITDATIDNQIYIMKEADVEGETDFDYFGNDPKETYKDTFWAAADGDAPANTLHISNLVSGEYYYFIYKDGSYITPGSDYYNRVIKFRQRPELKTEDNGQPDYKARTDPYEFDLFKAGDAKWVVTDDVPANYNATTTTRTITGILKCNADETQVFAGEPYAEARLYLLAIDGNTSLTIDDHFDMDGAGWSKDTEEDLYYIDVGVLQRNDDDQIDDKFTFDIEFTPEAGSVAHTDVLQVELALRLLTPKGSDKYNMGSTATDTDGVGYEYLYEIRDS